MTEKKRIKKVKGIDCSIVKEAPELLQNNIESLETESRRTVKRTPAKRVKFPRCVGSVV